MHCSFANVGHAYSMCSTVSSDCWLNLHWVSVSVCNIFVAWHFVCNAWSCAAVISLVVSPFKSRFDSHKEHGVFINKLLAVRKIYWPYITLLSSFSWRTLLILLLCVECPPCVAVLLWLILLQPLLRLPVIVEFILGRLLSWLLTIFAPALLYILRSDVLQYWQSLLYVSLRFVTGLFLLLSTHSLSTSVLGDTLLVSF